MAECRGRPGAARQRGRSGPLGELLAGELLVGASAGKLPAKGLGVEAESVKDRQRRVKAQNLDVLAALREDTYTASSC